MNNGEYLSIPQVAKRLGIAPRTVRGWVKQGIFPGARRLNETPFGTWLIPESALIAESVIVALGDARVYQRRRHQKRNK